MKHSDVEELARECGLIEPSDVWADLPADYTRAMSRLAALLLEKAAQVAKAEPRVWDFTAPDPQTRIHDKLLAMAAGMGE